MTVIVANSVGAIGVQRRPVSKAPNTSRPATAAPTGTPSQRQPFDAGFEGATDPVGCRMIESGIATARGGAPNAGETADGTIDALNRKWFYEYSTAK